MSDIRVLIVDDEPLARRGMRQLLAAYPDVTVVGECRDGREALRAIDGMAPDLVLLDVQMPDLDGFAVIRIRGADRMPPVVFVTAYDDFAVRAFESCALDYLVKPVSEVRFRDTMTRVRERLRVADAMALAERLSALLAAEGARHLGGRSPTRPPSAGGGRLAVTTPTGSLFLAHDEIDWIEATDDAAVVHAAGRDYGNRSSLASLERALDPGRFLRVHRGALVRLAGIREVRIGPRGRVEALLSDGSRVPVSRRRRARLEALLRAGSVGG